MYLRSKSNGQYSLLYQKVHKVWYSIIDPGIETSSYFLISVTGITQRTSVYQINVSRVTTHTIRSFWTEYGWLWESDWIRGWYNCRISNQCPSGQFPLSLSPLLYDVLYTDQWKKLTLQEQVNWRGEWNFRRAKNDKTFHSSLAPIFII